VLEERQPDVQQVTRGEVVHPTLEGIRAGRDEVLEAAIGVARKLLAK
jgi:hypothetical protein